MAAAELGRHRSPCSPPLPQPRPVRLSLPSCLPPALCPVPPKALRGLRCWALRRPTWLCASHAASVAEAPAAWHLGILPEFPFGGPSPVAAASAFFSGEGKA